MRALDLALAGLIGAWTGWRGGLHAIPYVESDRLFAQFARRGLRTNELSPPFLRTARRNDVPMDNPDTITRASVLDLSAGAMLFEADVPDDCVYWSVSVFAHNADTLYVANDQHLGPGPFQLLLRRSIQEARPGMAEVILPNTKGFLLIRLVMPDRNDRSDVERWKQVSTRARVTALS